MSFIPLVPGNLNLTMRQGLEQQVTSAAILNAGGTAIDFSAWFSMSAKMVPPTPVPYGSDTTFGTVTGSSLGVVTLLVSATDLASVPPGSATLIIEGKSLTGDSLQLVASGTLTIQAA